MVEIVHVPGVCGGRATFKNSRMTVWLVVSLRQHGIHDKTILEAYPSLTQAHLEAAMDYYRENSEEIARDIRENSQE